MMKGLPEPEPSSVDAEALSRFKSKDCAAHEAHHVSSYLSEQFNDSAPHRRGRTRYRSSIMCRTARKLNVIDEASDKPAW